MNKVKAFFRRLSPFLLPMLVFVFLIVGVVALSVVTRESINVNVKTQQELRNSAESSQFIRAINDKIDKYTYLLIEERGLFDASDEVTRDDWSAFVNSISLADNFQALKSMVYVKKVKKEDLAKFEKEVNNEPAIKKGLYPKFTVHPVTNKDVSFVVQYVQPLKGNEDAFGFDFYSTPDRAKLADRARDTNNLAVSEPLTLIQDKNGKSSFIMLLPVFKKNTDYLTLDGRRENLLGYVSLGIRAEDFFKRVMLTNSFSNLDGISVIDVTDGEKTMIPFMKTDGMVYNTDIAQEVQRSRISLGGRTWEIVFRSNKVGELSTLESSFPWLVLLSGGSISVLVALVLLNSVRLQSKAEGIAMKLNKDLEKFKLAVDNSTDLIAILDSRGYTVYINKAFEQTSGFSAKESFNKKFDSQLLWGGVMTEDFYIKMWSKVMVEKESFTSEIKNRKKSGEEYVVEANVSPVMDSDGEIIFIVVIERDVTKLMEVNKMKDDFLSIASHQLRTPLTSLKWSIELLQGTKKLDNEQKKYLQNVVDSTEKLTLLVNSFLDVNRADLGRIVVDKKSVQLDALIKQAVKQFDQKMSEKNIILKMGEIFDKEVFTDPDLVSEVVHGLVSNAINYSKEGGEIEIQTSQKEGQVVITVIDHGAGIKDADKNKVFEKFFRGDEIFSHNPNGKGLSLFLSKSIAKKLGGKIWFESELGKGTTFYFSFLGEK